MNLSPTPSLKSLDLERQLSRQAFAARLRAIADRLDEQLPFQIQVSGQRVHVPMRAECSIELEQEDDVFELELQLRWSRAEGRANDWA